MGDIGTPSRLLAGRFGAPFTYATFHHERTLAPGQLSFAQMKEIYAYDRVKATTAVYGVIGDPIGHSLSPLVHNAALGQAGIDGVYIPFRVPREHLQQFLDDAPALGVQGLSVTIPHKELVVRRLSKMDTTTEGVGAANTLIYRGGGIEGFNTDQQAAIDSLEAAYDAETDKPFKLEGKVALVLGAGGAAKAIAYGLKQRGAHVTIAGRTPQRAQPLATRLGCQMVEWSARSTVNPNVDATPFEKHHLRPSMLVFDTVYNPENTLLIKDARSQSCTTVTGVEMFIRQASLQFKLFTGLEGPSELMRDVLKRAIGPARY
jgi:3-dehydroquinate dehydratase/shikimate dehydrogenase